jgi:hypothetical protein
MFAGCIFLEISRPTITCSSKLFFFHDAVGGPLGQAHQQTTTLHETERPHSPNQVS